MKIIHSAFLSLLSLGSVSAFPSGAGRCVVGEAAPDGLHLADFQTITTGTLADGGYTASVNGIVVAEGDNVDVTLGEEFNIVISGPEFRGVLIMVADEDESVITPGPELKPADGQGCPGTASVTHSSPILKESALASVTLDVPTTTTIELNVVVQNSGGQSIYYYNSVNLQTIDPTDAPTDAPTNVPTAAPSAAPIAVGNGVPAPTAPPSNANVTAAPTYPPIPVPPAPAAGDCSYLGNTVQAGQWLRGPTHTCLCDPQSAGLWLHCTQNQVCPWGYKWVGGYCVRNWCWADYTCPPNSSRKEYRECYDNFDDCECDCGYHKSGYQCVKNTW